MLKKKDVVYYTKIIPSCGIYDVYDKNQNSRR